MTRAGTDAGLLAPVSARRALPAGSVRRPLRADASRVGLCLSGGGYRAMLFHVGALRALAVRGRLAGVTDLSGVSAGALVAACLARAGSAVRAASTPERVLVEVVARVERPLRRLARRTLDRPAFFAALLGRGTGADRLARALARHLVGSATFADLPQQPRLHVTSTRLEDGGLWCFDRAHAGASPSLARALAASCAFPPWLAPLALEGVGTLVDGGVVDNLGLETLWPACATIYASDAGAPLELAHGARWGAVRVGARAVQVLQREVGDLRRRQLGACFARPRGDALSRRGALWSLADGRRPDLARTPTRLAALAPDAIDALIRAGEDACARALDLSRR